MAGPLQIDVDLSDPGLLERVERDYLRVSVCPVQGRPSPGLLVPVTIILRLPGDVRVASSGQVIQELGEQSFLVHLDSPPDLAHLRRLAQEPPRAPRAPMPVTTPPLVSGPRRETGSMRSPAPDGPRPRPTGEMPFQTPTADAPFRTSTGEVPVRKPTGEMPVRKPTGEMRARMSAAEMPAAPPPVAVPTRTPTRPSTPLTPPAPGFAQDAGHHGEAPRSPGPGGAGPSASPGIALVDTLLDPDLDLALVGEAFPSEGQDPAADFLAEPSDDPSPASLANWTPDLDALLEPGAHPGGRQTAASSPAVEAGPDVSGKESDSSDVYSRIKGLTLPEKQRLARHGRRTVRQLLVRDPNKNLHRLVVANPDVGLEEIAEYSAYPALSKEAIEFIAQNRTWLSSRQIVFNLVRNPSTPVELAARLVPRLGPNEWRWLARPGSVRTPIAAAARKQIVDGASG